MKFKRIICITLSISFLVLAGCKRNTVAENKPKDELKGKIVVWSNKENINTLKSSIENYKKIHENVTIDLLEKSKDDLLSSTDLPDMICVDDEDVQTVLKKFSNTFENTSDDIKKENYLKYKIDNLTFEGNLYGIPFNSRPVIMVYRTDILEAAKINPEYIKTWEDFVEAGKKIKSNDRFMIALSLEEERTYRMFLNQLGGSYFDKEGKPSINSQKPLKAAEILKRISSSEIARNIKSNTDAVGLIKEGKIASAMVSPEDLKEISKQAPELKGKLKIMKLPAFEDGGNQSVSFNGSNILIVNKSENKKAALDFAKFTSENKENISSFIKSLGLLPAYTYNYDEKWFKAKDEYFEDRAPMAVFSNVAKDIYTINYTDNFSKIIQPVQEAFSSIVLKGSDIKITLDDAQKRIETNNK